MWTLDIQYFGENYRQVPRLLWIDNIFNGTKIHAILLIRNLVDVNVNHRHQLVAIMLVSLWVVSGSRRLVIYAVISHLWRCSELKYGISNPIAVLQFPFYFDVSELFFYIKTSKAFLHHTAKQGLTLMLHLLFSMLISGVCFGLITFAIHNGWMRLRNLTLLAITLRNSNETPGKTRTTRTPAFWDTPPPHDYPYWWFTSDPKSKQDIVKVTNFSKNCQTCWNLARYFTHDTPYQVA